MQALSMRFLQCKSFKEYIEQYTKNNCDHTGDPYKVVHEKVNPRWEIAVTVSERGFQQVPACLLTQSARSRLGVLCQQHCDHKGRQPRELRCRPDGDEAHRQHQEEGRQERRQREGTADQEPHVGLRQLPHR